MIPTYDQFIEPVLRYLAAYPEGAEVTAVYEAAAVACNLTTELREQVTSSGKSTYRARILWAHDRLKRAGLSEASRRGVWRLTQKGTQFAKSHAHPLSCELVAKLATKNDGSRLRPVVAEHNVRAKSPLRTTTTNVESVLASIRDSVATEVLHQAHCASRTRFGALVCAVLSAEGYGEAQTGEDIDTVDGLFITTGGTLPPACVLAKQLTRSLAESRVRSLHDSMLAHRLSQAVFVSTSGFSNNAQRYAHSVTGVRLICGVQLAELMMTHRLGTATRQVEIPQVNADYFADQVPLET